MYGWCFLVTFAESSCMSSQVITWEPGVNWRKVFRIDISPTNSAPGQNKFTRDEKPRSWSLRPIKWITVEEQKIIHEWHLIYSNLIAQNLNVDSVSVCSVLCDMSITFLKKIFWGRAVSLVFCYRCIMHCPPLEMLLEKPHGNKCHCVIFVFCTGRQRVLLTCGHKL